MILADSFRVTGEKEALVISVVLMALVAVLLTGMTLGIFAVALLGALLYLKIRMGSIQGGAVKVGPDQFPEIYDAAQRAAERLSMKMPSLYVSQSPVLNAYAIGFLGEKSVVLNSGIVCSMTKAELASIIGHELSHVKCKHTDWLLLTSGFENERIPVVSDILRLVFLAWSRKAEHTCDRGGLIATGGDVRASVSALAKLAVGPELFKALDLDRFTQQADQTGASVISEALSTHPFLLKRISAIITYGQSREFKQLMTNEMSNDEAPILGVKAIMIDDQTANKDIRWRRLIAGFIDMAIAGLIVFAILSIKRLLLLSILKKGLIVLLPSFYLLIKDSLAKGQSIGKLVTGVMVYNEKESSPGGLLDSIIRNWYLAIPVLGPTLFVVIICIQILLGKRKRLGDRQAGTIVVTTEEFERAASRR
jgi:Zn-dependent protease with chaperone function/uncharacterized RDD family membrane protein YckC